jgi:hypothetical protein
MSCSGSVQGSSLTGKTEENHERHQSSEESSGLNPGLLEYEEAAVPATYPQ